MARALKFVLWFAGAFVALFVISAIALNLFFDPNDFRDQISKAVKKETGREFVIEGDIKLDLFPWLAVDIGAAQLGNAAGFGEEPMASIDSASFSVRLLPVIFSQEVVVGAADIDGLKLNLGINRQGVSNWSDLVPEESADTAADDDGPARTVDVNSIEVTNAVVRYSNAESGETIVLDDVNLTVGKLTSDGSFVPIDASMSFDVRPAMLSGNLDLDMALAFDSGSSVMKLQNVEVSGSIAGVAAIPTTMRFATDAVEVALQDSVVSMEPLEIALLDMQIDADVETFSYKERITPSASIVVDEFSPRSVMQLFDVEPPQTADPSVLSRMSIVGKAQLTTAAIELSDISIEFDDTKFSGSMAVPRLADGSYTFTLQGDTIDLARYMAPADEAAAAGSGDAVPVEIPADMIRTLNARGSLTVDSATLGDLVFENVSLGLNAGNGKLRLHPVSSALFGGTYKGDVRIDVSGSLPALSVNENIEGVDLSQLAVAMFDQENVTGSINGNFVLAGSGADTVAIQKNLSGNIAMNLSDGSYQGTDIWFELRRARAVLKGEAPPELEQPVQTAFSEVKMTGVVSNGIMQSNDLFAELPFMQLTGQGQVDIPAATVDYRLNARILERPEFLTDATEAELDEFTEAVIPMRITGPLTDPSVKPDLEKLLRQRVEKEVKEKLEDELKDKLKGLFD